METPRTRLLLAGVVLLVGLVLVAPANPPGDGRRADARTAETVDYARPGTESPTRLWPYTSRRRSFAAATLPINVVVRADAARVYSVLTAGDAPPTRRTWNGSAGRWEAGPPEHPVQHGTTVQWTATHGAERYTFVRTDDRGRWLDATYQLHDGTYFGGRYHLRLYGDGSGDTRWTAIQAHYEYWDWFQLSHDVTSLSRARHHLERDVAGTGVVTDIRRERYGNGGAIDADGWVSVIDVRAPDTGPGPERHPERRGQPASLLPLVLGLGLLVGYEADVEQWSTAGQVETAVSAVTGSHLALAGGTAAVPLVVRAGAIAVERSFPAASPVLVGAPWYLLLVVGLPAVATAFGRRLPPAEAFATAVCGLGAGIVTDYLWLGLATVPVGAVVQRLVLLFGLGLIAAGGQRWRSSTLHRHRYRVVGLACWVGGLAWPLL